MKKLLVCSFAVAAVALLSGCVAVKSPVVGSIYTDVSGTEAVTANSGSSKTGTAMAQGILGFATGDASVKAAAANGGITKIHHVDFHTTSVLGVWGKHVVTVYGE